MLEATKTTGNVCSTTAEEKGRPDTGDGAASEVDEETVLDEEVRPKDGFRYLRQRENMGHLESTKVKRKSEGPVTAGGRSIRCPQRACRPPGTCGRRGREHRYIGASVHEEWAVRAAAEQRERSSRGNSVDGGERAGMGYCLSACPFP